MQVRGYVCILIALASAAAYAAWASWLGVVGFALDDAWIHQVYARNLALRGEFAFTPGLVSTGSTSPLWTLTLVPAFWLQIDPRAWTLLWGAFLLGLSAILAARLASGLMSYCPAANGKWIPTLAALAIILEWHLAWGAVSGMEIPLFVFLSLLLLERFYSGERTWILGILAGLLFLTRPEGLLLAGIVGTGLIVEIGLRAKTRREHESQEGDPKRLFLFGLALVLILLPYFVFNYWVSGTFFPNTFYAKNAEYGIIAEQVPYPVRWLRLLFVPWIGVGVLLAPGLAYLSGVLISRKKWLALLPLFWVVLLPALYAWRLPVSYQHGRYEIPVIPIILIYGMWGTVALLQHIRIRIVRRTWAMSIAAVLVTFWMLGANTYATDVAVIDCEMVQSARWVSENVSLDSVVAVHDIGAFGYLNNRPLIDLAGLISPEVIPFIRDEVEIRKYLLSRKVDYAVFFPDWYPLLAGDSRFVPVRNQSCPVVRQLGATDMVIYRIRYD